MAGLTSSIIGGGLAVGGALLGNKGARDAQQAQQDAIAASRTNLPGFDVSTALGFGGRALPDSSRIDLGLAQGGAVDLTQFANRGARDLATNQFAGLPPEIMQALQQAGGVQGPGVDPSLNLLQPQTIGQFGDAGQALSLRLAQGLQGPEAVRSRELDLLRQQAQPFEDRAFQNLQESQFATGRAGTSGGGLQTEAFARGLGQADLSRQLAATQLGQQQQGLQENLLQGAFGRFAGLGGLTADIGQQRFGQQLGGASFQQQAGQQNLQNQIQAAGLPFALQGAQLSPVLSALQGQAGIQGQGLDLFNAGLQRAIAEANAVIGSGSNVSQIVGSRNFNPGASSDLLGGLLTGAGQRVATGQGGGVVGDILGGIFGGGGQQSLQEINTSFIPRRI